MNNLVTSICNLNTRKFGDVGEILMTKIIKGLEKSDDLSYDKKLGSKKGEVKVSRAFRKAEPITESNICEVLMRDNSVRLIEDNNKLSEKWDCKGYDLFGDHGRNLPTPHGSGARPMYGDMGNYQSCKPDPF